MPKGQVLGFLKEGGNGHIYPRRLRIYMANIFGILPEAAFGKKRKKKVTIVVEAPSLFHSLSWCPSLNLSTNTSKPRQTSTKK